MIRAWGMSEKLGPMSYAKGEEQVFLGREIAQHRDYSDETARLIDSEISGLINGAYTRARKVLEENVDILHKLSDLLLEKETVMGSELNDLILAMRPGIRLPSFHPIQEEGDAEGKDKSGPTESGEAVTLKQKAAPAAPLRPKRPAEGRLMAAPGWNSRHSAARTS